MSAPARKVDLEYLRNYKIDGQYMYDDDLMLSEYNPREVIQKVMDMDLEPTDICVASYPKAGTTLTQEIIWLLRHNANEEKAKEHNFQRVPYVEDTYDKGIEKFYELEHPRHYKTHLPFRYLPKQITEKSLKLIYVYRNPKDALVSYYYFYRAVFGMGFFEGTWDDFFDMFYTVNRGILCYGNILKHYKSYWEHKDDKNIFLVSYENLVKNPRGEMTRMAQFADIQYDDALIEKVMKMTTFDTMKKNPATNFECFAEISKFDVSPFMRKGKVGDWKNHFSADQSAKIDKMVEDILGGTGMEFIYE